MLKLLVGSGGGYKKTLLVASSQTADYPSTSNCAVANGNYILQFGLEDAVEVF